MLRPNDPNDRVKYILVTGGVCSSLGKGVTTSTIGAMLKMSGFRVCAIKIDPYINPDAGLMSPFEHGEVFVLNDGGEVDLDLGNYERWLDVKLCRDHNITTGKIYKQLLEKERRGDFLGKTVQVVPHFTNRVVEIIEEVAKRSVDDTLLPPQVCLIELGGTVGDLESAPFIEALRTLRFTLPKEDFALVHCTYLPEMGGAQKTKPSQHSCRNLLSLGMTADFLVCRSENPLSEDARAKLSQQCSIREKYIIDAHNVKSLYEVPLVFNSQELPDKLIRRLQLNKVQCGPPPMTFPTIDDFRRYNEILVTGPQKKVSIVFVGKYVKGGGDAYFSVIQAFEHCSLALNVAIQFLWVDSELLEEGQNEEKRQMGISALEKADGIFVPGGFGRRGINGKVAACRIAREKGIPFFGVCLGMQVALIEVGRTLLGWKDATSEEFDTAKESNHHVLVYMPEIDPKTMGANMRLGDHEVNIVERSSRLSAIYSHATKVSERHRHRYEFNINYLKQFQDVGVHFVGVDDPTFSKDARIEAIELPSHPHFLAVQYHPEFISHVADPSPPYLSFLAAAAKMEYKFPDVNRRAVA